MKEIIRSIVLSAGADVCGIASTERFESAQQGFRPMDILKECKSVIVFGIALPKGLTKVSSRLIYGHFNNLSCIPNDIIAFNSAKKMEEQFDCIAVPLPSDGPYEYWNEEKLEGKGLISMKYAAVQAGIGSIGKSTLLINEKYGNLLILGAILTDLKLKSDDYSRNLCIDGCRKCVDSCPVFAINDGFVNQSLCRKNTYGKNKRGFDTVDCNQCRIVCPLKYGV